MKNTVVKYYPDCWFKVAYIIKDVSIDFKAYEIEGLDELDLQQSLINRNAVLTGFIKWDGCCEFNYNVHWCGIHKAEQFLILMKEIYSFKKFVNL